MTKDEALKLALEAFDSMIGRKPERVEQAITAIKEALAQPEQEPVAWFHLHNCEAYFTTEPSEDMVGNYWTPLYASPPQRQPLTTEQLPPIPSAYRDGVYLGYCKSDFTEYARAIEAKLNDKNGF